MKLIMIDQKYRPAHIEPLQIDKFASTGKTAALVIIAVMLIGASVMINAMGALS